jgi:hypothetical protein
VASLAATRFASAADRMLQREVLTPLRLAERWSERPTEETGWYASGAVSGPSRAPGAAWAGRAGRHDGGAVRAAETPEAEQAATGAPASGEREADASGRGSAAEPASDVVQGVFVDGGAES